MDTPLSCTELGVAELVANGMSVEKIADVRHRSHFTITRQIQSCYDKLNIPRQLNALAVWYVCVKNNIDIPEYIKKGAVMIMAAIILISPIDDKQWYRRTQRRNRHEQENTI